MSERKRKDTSVTDCEPDSIGYQTHCLPFWFKLAEINLLPLQNFCGVFHRQIPVEHHIADDCLTWAVDPVSLVFSWVLLNFQLEALRAPASHFLLYLNMGR